MDAIIKGFILGAMVTHTSAQHNMGCNDMSIPFNSESLEFYIGYLEWYIRTSDSVSGPFSHMLVESLDSERKLIHIEGGNGMFAEYLRYKLREEWGVS